MLPVLGEWLDILIFLSYISIPVQLVLLLLKPPVVMDHRKLTSTFSNMELFRTRLLLLYFAMFIIFCGLGHGINAMCSATTDESLWCFLVVPGKMVIALTSGATSVMLLLWMPSLTTWLRAIEIHRRGFTEVVVNELSHSNELANITFGSVMHVQELANKVEQLQAALEASQAEPGPRSEPSTGSLMSCVTKFWKGKKKAGEAARKSGYQRVAPQKIGHTTGDTSAGGKMGGLAASSSSSMRLACDEAGAETMTISFVGPSWVTCSQSESFRDLCGSCGSLQEFSSMLLEGRTLMGQAHAAIGALNRSKHWRRSLVCEVTLVPPGDPNFQYRADCAIKAVRRCENAKELDVVHIWLWGLGAQVPRDQRSKPRSAGSQEPSCAGSTTMSRNSEEDQGSSRVWSTAQSGDPQRRQRERAAFNAVQRKLPDLEEMLVQAGRTWRAQENRQKQGDVGEAGFRQAVSRLDIARLCLELPPLMPRLHFERKSGISEVYDARDVARSAPVDLLAGQRLESWLWQLHDETERMPMRGVALIAQQATHIYATVDFGSPQRACAAGEVLIAAGPPQEANGVVMVPVEREGVVQIGYFAIEYAAGSLIAARRRPSMTQEGGMPTLDEQVAQAVPLQAALPQPADVDFGPQDCGGSSDSSTDREDEQLNFRLGLMS